MNQTNLFRRRRLALLFCVILIFAAALPVTAFADNAVVTSGSMYSYFQTFGSNGQWKDIQTPSHWITNTGDVAYCLQTSNDTPYYSSYTSVDGAAYYSQYVLTGLRAILENGYPVTNGGFTDEQARYATANAIRFWCAENYCDGMPQYLNLNVNGDWIRGKSGYEDLYYWALSLVLLARNQAVSSPSAGTISFNPSSITLSEDAAGNYFTGQTTVRKTFSNAYGLSHNFPSGSTIDGYTFNDGDTLTISIPTQYENGTYTLTGYGADNVSTAKLFFWAPDAANQQRVVTCVLDNESIYLEANCTVYTPAKAVRTGSFQITKVDESNRPLSGVSFALYDSGQNQISSGQTDSNGVVTFSGLPLGDYFYAETASLPGYVFDSSLKAVSITENGQVVTVTATNTLARGNIQISKTDEYGSPLSGITFSLYDSNQNQISNGQTSSNGVVVFSSLPLGDYFYAETASLPGYVFDNSLKAVSITENGQVVTVTATNTLARGSIQITKVNESGAPLPGVTFALYDSSQNQISSGQTDSNGVITFTELLLGDYFYAETDTLFGYIPDPALYPVSITENGQLVTVSATNRLAHGYISIVKKNSADGSPLAGVHFVMRDSSGSIAAEGDTDSSGALSLGGLLLGSYTLTETATLSGYVMDNSETPVELTADGQIVELEFTNTPIKGTLEITKKAKGEDIALSGAGYRLFDASGTQIAEGYTDTWGKLSFTDLPYGSYTYQEFKAPAGFLVDETDYEFSIVNQDELVSHTRENGRRSGTIEIKKRTADGSPLTGAAYTLEYSDDDGSTWHPVFSRLETDDVSVGGCTSPGLSSGQIYTDNAGNVKFTGLRADRHVIYRVTETAAPEGYSLLSGSLFVGVLPIESENIYAADAEVFDRMALVYTLVITATDDPVFRLPEAGGTGFSYLPLLMMLCTAPTIIFISTKKKGKTE